MCKGDVVIYLRTYHLKHMCLCTMVLLLLSTFFTCVCDTEKMHCECACFVHVWRYKSYVKGNKQVKSHATSCSIREGNS